MEHKHFRICLLKIQRWSLHERPKLALVLSLKMFRKLKLLELKVPLCIIKLCRIFLGAHRISVARSSRSQLRINLDWITASLAEFLIQEIEYCKLGMVRFNLIVVL